LTIRSRPLKQVQKVHRSLVLQRREEVLARTIARMLPDDVETALDVGCGDGVIASAVAAERPGLRFEGVEVLDRKTCQIPYRLFDGKTLPFPDGHVDYVEVVDVLHHTDDIDHLVRECARVSRKYVLIKDHLWDNRLDFATLRFMDWVGNRSYGVNLIYNYQKKEQWLRILALAGLEITDWREEIGLYPFPFNLVFERRKHFVALLAKVPKPSPTNP
jgi:SAM-dependent methyltransferase